uniref:Olfactory marker protein b n=1 Tax=Amphiprion percula TaxID=161767 RepID=A0A3P8SSE7_AMPPE
MLNNSFTEMTVCRPSMSTELELPFRLDTQLTEVMRLRVQSLQQRGQKRQEGERLLQANEAVYRLDFSKQSLRFSHWTVRLAQAGRLTITATSQLWTPDLTNLMTRQLLEPAGVFWRAAGYASDAPVQCYEADADEFGERIAELAKVRKVMYFLFAFEEGCSPETVDGSITFTVES